MADEPNSIQEMLDRVAQATNDLVPDGWETVYEFAERHDIPNRKFVADLVRLPVNPLPSARMPRGRIVIPIEEADRWYEERRARMEEGRDALQPADKLILTTLSWERLAKRLDAAGWLRTAEAVRNVIKTAEEEAKDSVTERGDFGVVSRGF